MEGLEWTCHFLRFSGPEAGFVGLGRASVARTCSAGIRGLVGQGTGEGFIGRRPCGFTDAFRMHSNKHTERSQSWQR